MEILHLKTPAPLSIHEIDTTPEPQKASPDWTPRLHTSQASWKNIREMVATTPAHALTRLIDAQDALENLTNLPKSIDQGRQIYFETKRALYRAHHRGNPHLQREIELDGLHRLAHLIHQVNLDPKGTEILLEKEAIDFNDKMMDTLMLDLLEIDDQLKEGEDLAGMQSQDRIAHRLLTQKIASLLVLKDGSINFGLIPAIRDLIPKALHSCSGGRHHDPLEQGLTHLELNRPLRKMIEQINPEKLHPKGEFLVRISCGLSPYASVRRRDIQITVLTALLSRLRQGSVGSCFATAPGIGILAWHPEMAVKDFVEMLTTGQIIKGGSACPFILSMAEDDLHEDGDAEYGVFAALHQIGVLDRESKEWWYNQHSDAFTSPAKVMMEIAKEKELYPLEKSVHLMKCAFEAQTHDPLLRAWEGCLASMNQAEKSDLKDSLKYSLKSLEDTLNELGDDDLGTEFVTHLLNRSRVIFDHALRTQGMLETEEPMGSGFWLCDSFHEESSDKWKLIKTPDQMRRLMLRAWEETATAIGIEKLTPILPQVMEIIRKDETLLEMLRRTHSSNSGMNELRGWNHKRFTPWMERAGGHKDRVLSVYFEHPEKVVKQSIQPLSVPHLLRRVLDVGRGLPINIQRQLKTRPDLPLAVGTIGHHAFALTLSDPSMVKAWSDERNPRRWIEEELMAPMRRSAHMIVVPKEFDKAVEVIKERYISSWNEEEFEEGIAQIPREGLWRCELRNRLATLVAQCRGSHLKSRLRSIDRILFEILPEDEQKDLEDRIVTFADTNWYDEAHDVQIGVGPNPWGESLSLWRVIDGEGRGRVMETGKWVHDHRWTFYAYNQAGYLPSGAT